MNLTFLTEQLQQQYPDSLGQILAGLKAKRKTTLRINTLKTDAVSVMEELRQAGLPYEVSPLWENALILPHGSEPALRGLSCYQQGEIYLQGLTSMLPPLYLGARPGEDILDMAAAPGGKTSELVQLTQGQAYITACENQPVRAQRLRSNLDRLGCGRVTVVQQDARKLDDFLRFDRILLDAPCSGSGTLNLTDEKSCSAFSNRLVENSARLQKQLLRKAADLLKDGGTLVYSTCSVLRQENEDNVRQAMKLGLTLMPLPENGPAGLSLLQNTLPGTWTVQPDEYAEGFFVACLKKGVKA